MKTRAAAGGERQTMMQLLEFFKSCGVTQLNFAVLEPRKNGGWCMKGDKRCRDEVEVIKCLPWAGARNHLGFDVYVRPARYDAYGDLADHALLFLDDIPSVMANKICKKYKACSVETSLNNCQVWLATDRQLTEEERMIEQAEICRQVGSDKKSVSGEHFGRAVGFRNKKKNRNNEIVKIIAMSMNLPAYPAYQVGKNIKNDKGVRFSPPAAARDLEKGLRGASGESDKEFAFACISLQRGMAIDKVVEKIADHAFNRGKRKTRDQAIIYAENTVAAAQHKVFHKKS